MSNMTNGLQKNLKTRHISMISIAGVIGAGLFVGSGAVIHSAGPGSILSYSFAGLLVIFIMRMLGKWHAPIRQAVPSHNMRAMPSVHGPVLQLAGFIGSSG